MAKALKWVGYLTIVLAFIGGIVAGNLYGPLPEYEWEDKEFAWSIMLMIWCAGGISAIFTFGFAALLEHIENMSNKLDNIEAAAVIVASTPLSNKPL